VDAIGTRYTSKCVIIGNIDDKEPKIDLAAVYLKVISLRVVERSIVELIVNRNDFLTAISIREYFN